MPHQGELSARIGRVGVSIFLEVKDGLVGILLLEQHCAERVVVIGVVGIQTDCFFQRLLGFRRQFQFDADHSEEEVNGGVSGFQVAGVCQVTERAFKVSGTVGEFWRAGSAQERRETRVAGLSPEMRELLEPA